MRHAHRLFVLPLLTAMAATSNAQLAFDPLTVHPANVAREGQFLLVIEDSWQNGCQGQIDTTVSAERIEVVATSDQSDSQACTTAFVPFVDLINPRDEFTGEFGAEVAVEYVFVAPDGTREVRDQETVSFGSGLNPTSQVESGSWVTDALQSSGLFIDQQEGLFSANLADYANGTGTWFFGAAPVEGNVVIAELSQFGTVQCVTDPCNRAAAIDSGRLLAVLEGQNSLLVKYRSILEESDLEQAALRYTRLDLSRAQGLGGVPDLTGRWIIGVGPEVDVSVGEPIVSSFGVFDLTVIDDGPATSLSSTSFGARDINRLDDSNIPDFVIVCQDARPVDGDLACTTADLTLGEPDCVAEFPFSAAGLNRIEGVASCGSGQGQFVMERR
ncbi:MAG: hypothetical protein AAF358_16675 [Pseudomonadota bacterium]